MHEQKYPMPPDLHLGDRGVAPRVRGVQLCKEWIAENLETRRHADTSQSSYWYKHRVEEFYGEYISNQDFIVAMHELGYLLKPSDSRRVNFYFNAKLRRETIKKYRETHAGYR